MRILDCKLTNDGYLEKVHSIKHYMDANTCESNHFGFLFNVPGISITHCDGNNLTVKFVEDDKCNYRCNYSCDESEYKVTVITNISGDFKSKDNFNNIILPHQGCSFEDGDIKDKLFIARQIFKSHFDGTYHKFKNEHETINNRINKLYNYFDILERRVVDSHNYIIMKIKINNL